MMNEGVQIDWLGGNCPVQAEGKFDNVPFYFRARGESVYVEIESQKWIWHGPEYTWPEAGWIEEEVALQYIHTAYDNWKTHVSR